MNNVYNAEKGRESNIELLRCIAIYFVVLMHCFNKTGGINALEKESYIYYLAWFLYNACGMGNNVLIIISGYFWRRIKVNINKVVNMWMQVWFYSVGFWIIAKFILKIELTSEIKQAILPLTSGEYWYFTTYIGLYCLLPWIKILLDNISKVQFKKLMIVLTILLSVIPTILGCIDWLGDGGAYGIVWFIYLYLMGAFIEQLNIKLPRCISMAALLICLFIAPVYEFLVEWIGLDGNRVSTMYSLNMLHNLMASVFLFLCIRNIKIRKRYEDIVRYFGQGCFGVYLIHNNRNVAHYMWEKLNVYYWLTERKNLLAIIIICIVVFVVCNVLEHFRTYIFKKMYVDKFINNMCNWLVEIVGKVLAEDNGK